MTLYDEAGLSSQASADEIRHAYHNFVRLLHPDTVQDPALRSLAEAQLRRVNAIFEVLNDPQRRAQYDLTLRAPLALEAVAHTPRAALAPMVAPPYLGGVVLVVSILLGWAVLRTPARPVDMAPNAEGLEIPPSTFELLPQEAAAHELRQLRRERIAVRRELAPADSNAGPRDPLGGAADMSPISQAASEARRSDNPEPMAGGTMGAFPNPNVEHAASSRLATPATPALPAPLAATERRSSLAGTWLYAQRANPDTRSDWYPPDFIELKLQAVPGGGLVGRYQARYRVGNLPISPEVRFRFQGDPDFGAAMPWFGANGARGEVRLKQTTPLTLLVDWNLTHPGELPSLTSGSALLVRSPE